MKEQELQCPDEGGGNLPWWVSRLGGPQYRGSPCEDLVENGAARWALDSSRRGLLGSTGTVTRAASHPCVKSARHRIMSGSFHCHPGSFRVKRTCRTCFQCSFLRAMKEGWFCLRKEKRKSQVWTQCLRNCSCFCICWICSNNIYSFVIFSFQRNVWVRQFQINVFPYPRAFPWTIDPPYLSAS